MYLKKQQKRKKKSCMGHLGEIWVKYEQKHSGIEHSGIYTYSTVPRLGKHKGKRESTVSMSKSVGENPRDQGTGKIMTEKKKEGRPVEFLVKP